MEPAPATQDRIKQLTEAVQGLTGEVKRLQTNLDQMHKLQATLLQVTQQLMQWAEKLESRDSATHVNTTSTSTISHSTPEQ